MAWLVYQIHRIAWAFDHDGAAFVQGLSALLTTAVTGILCWVTWRYVRLTNIMAETMKRQLSASMQPFLLLSILEEKYQTEENQPIILHAKVAVKNRGAQPVKLVRMSVFVQYWPNNSARHGMFPKVVLEGVGRVLMPEEEEIQVTIVQTEIRYRGPGRYGLRLHVECTDLSGVSEHSFVLEPPYGLRHFFGFWKPAKRTLLVRIRSRWYGVVRSLRKRLS